MNILKKLLLVGVGIAALAFVPVASAQNETTNLVTGITDVPSGGFTNAGAAAVIQTLNHQEVAVDCEYSLASIANLGTLTNVTFYFAPSNDGTNPATGSYPAQWTGVVIPPNGLGRSRGGTNIYVGSYPYLVFVGVSSPITNTPSKGTNITVSARFKHYRFGR